MCAYVCVCIFCVSLFSSVQSLSRVQLFATPRTAAFLAPPSMGFSRQEYWNGVPLPSPAAQLVKCNLIQEQVFEEALTNDS